MARYIITIPQPDQPKAVQKSIGRHNDKIWRIVRKQMGKVFGPPNPAYTKLWDWLLSDADDDKPKPSPLRVRLDQIEDEILARPIPTERQLRNKRDAAFRKTRLLVWERDGPICQVCREEIDMDYYECGHKIDRVCGGSDDPENLVVMCNLCNRLKPLTDTLEEYEAWAATGGQRKVFTDAIQRWYETYGQSMT